VGTAFKGRAGGRGTVPGWVFLASVPDLPGVMDYGVTESEAVRKVKAIALQVLADRIESGDGSCSRYERLKRIQSRGCLQRLVVFGLESQEAGGITPEASKARLAEFHFFASTTAKKLDQRPLRRSVKRQGCDRRIPEDDLAVERSLEPNWTVDSTRPESTGCAFYRLMPSRNPTA